MQKRIPGTEALPDALAERLAEGAGGCWTFPNADPREYATYRHEGQMRNLHRLVYSFLVGPIPDGLTLDHLCCNKACCNPAHLEPVTRAENSRRAQTPESQQRREALFTRPPRYHTYTPTLPKAEAEAVIALAKRSGRSINRVFIEAMRAYLAAHGESEREGGTAD